MEFILRYFIDGNADCKGYTWSYDNAAHMIIPRIGERVWVDNICVEVDMVTYSPNRYDDKLYLVDIECHDITDDVMTECDKEDF